MEDEQKAPTIDATTNERLDVLIHTVELLASLLIKTKREIKLLEKYVRIIVRDHDVRLAGLEENDNE